MMTMAIRCQASETSEWKGSVRMEAASSRALGNLTGDKSQWPEGESEKRPVVWPLAAAGTRGLPEKQKPRRPDRLRLGVPGTCAKGTRTVGHAGICTSKTGPQHAS
ncbi:hypothetical protein M431DRAFT_414482 [Trichoderma harzianum CBS 226.95]|uniref:Uncharacterized protein n=1 Tax=Trichoderma harzianum CBS 226.95 TaxID=983964 RepID=A0A2T4AG31_TRIHA|nr:hypothetical protein M431DRAFT_414482 [Trichoderma harzianum CBS 226.95]PTB55962.1 hypothetical protein M431DRAFT_414482 [Trichoderma harzianum CBS 226.95]